MRFEKNNQNNKQNNWKYSATLSFPIYSKKAPDGVYFDQWKSPAHREAVETLEVYLKSRAVGNWQRRANVIYMQDLEDIFNVRLFFNDIIDVIRQST